MNKKKIIIAVVAVLAVVGIFAGIIAGSYNGLVSKQENVENTKAQIQTVLQRRADLIPNLVNTVKGYAAHEEKVYTELAEARAKLGSAKTTNELAEANSQLESSLSRLLLVVENYPELKADKNFINLQDELSRSENRISVARKDYNDAVTEYNKTIKKFPTVIVAKMFGFDAFEYFEASSESQKAPDVNF